MSVPCYARCAICACGTFAGGCAGHATSPSDVVAPKVARVDRHVEAPAGPAHARLARQAAVPPAEQARWVFPDERGRKERAARLAAKLESIVDAERLRDRVGESGGVAFVFVANGEVVVTKTKGAVTNETVFRIASLT